MRGWKSLSLSCGALLCIPPALAQTQPAQASTQPAQPDGTETSEPATGAPGQLTDIIVTAQRRSESVNRVPATITAVTGDQLRKAATTDFKDLTALTTNVSIDGAYGGGNGSANVTIRGVGLADYNDNNSAPAGIYVDDVYLVSPAMLIFGLYDFDRVEVLKGPQGTLYGRNTTAGAVSLYARLPSDTASADGEARVETYDRFTVTGGVTMPLAQGLSARISGIGDFGGGWMRNRVTGTVDNDREYWAGRGLLRWRPSETIDLMLNVHGGRDRSGLGQYQHGGLVDPDTGAICAAALAGRVIDNGCVDVSGYGDTDRDRSAGDYNLRGTSRYDNFGTSLRANVDLGGAVLTSITAWERLTGRRVDESDAGPARLLETDYGTRIRQFSQEVRLDLELGSVDLIVGGFYGSDLIRGSNLYDVLGEFRPAIAATGLAPASGFLPSGVDPDGVVSALFRSETRQRSTSLAGFGHAIWTVAPGVKVQAGLRYTRDTRAFHTASFYQEDPASLAFYGLPADGSILSAEDRRRWRRLTGIIGASYEPRPGALFYATVSNGYKSGGFGGGALLDPRQAVSYDPESITAYETGAKLSLFGRRLQLNGAFFYYDYSDLQLFSTQNSGAVPIEILTNAASARVYGIDADAQFRVTPELDLRLGVGTAATRLLDAPNVGGLDRSGERFISAPRLTLNGTATYRKTIGRHAATAQVIARYQSTELLSYRLEEGGRNIVQRPFWIIDPRLAFGSADRGWEVALYARNLFDVRPITSVLNLSDYGLAELNILPPRQIGVSLSAGF